jgi:hypothetical protein
LGVGANVANLGLDLLLAEALVIGGHNQSISQLHYWATGVKTTGQYRQLRRQP